MPTFLRPVYHFIPVNAFMARIVSIGLSLIPCLRRDFLLCTKEGMVFLSGNHPKRTPAQKAQRYGLGVLACALIIFILWQIPYDILREERYRIYGETRTTGVVVEVNADSTGESYPFVIRYKYLDMDGIARDTTAPLPREIWEMFRPGNKVDVFYITSRPHMARIAGEIEPAFQLWIREILQ